MYDDRPHVLTAIHKCYPRRMSHDSSCPSMGHRIAEQLHGRERLIRWQRRRGRNKQPEGARGGGGPRRRDRRGAFAPLLRPQLPLRRGRSARGEASPATLGKALPPVRATLGDVPGRRRRSEEGRKRLRTGRRSGAAERQRRRAPGGAQVDAACRAIACVWRGRRSTVLPAKSEGTEACAIVAQPVARAAHQA